MYKRLNSTATLIQKTTMEAPHETLCITSDWMFTSGRLATGGRDGSGTTHAAGTLTTRFDLDRWMKTLPQPWTAAAMETKVFRGWICDHLQSQAAALQVGHPLMLRAMMAAENKFSEPAHQHRAPTDSYRLTASDETGVFETRPGTSQDSNRRIR